MEPKISVKPQKIETKETVEKKTKEQLREERQREIEIASLKIVQVEREIRFKQDQLNSKQSLEKHENYKDGIKPLFYIENEMNQLQFHIEQNKKRIKTIQEAMEKDV